MRLTVISASHGAGQSIAVLEGVDEDDMVWRFGADWRCAYDIAEALEAGEDVEVEIEDWQVLGGPRPLAEAQS